MPSFLEGMGFQSRKLKMRKLVQLKKMLANL